MNHKPQNRKLERVTYWEGQMLRSSDFLDIQRVESQRRWWHNRAMHSAYGAYEGLQAKAIDATSDQPASVQVSPGVAYDCFGRELVLGCRATVQYLSQPIAPGSVRTLVVRYKAPLSRKQTDAVAAVCCFCGEAGATGNVEFAWIDCARISPEQGVPLGMLRNVGALRARFSPLVTPPPQRPLARPHLATGTTVSGQTSWQPWDFTLPADPLARQGSPPIELGVETTIDTSAAGFTEMPQYFAWLEGPIWNSRTLELVPALLPSLANESLGSFTFRLILMRIQNESMLEEFEASPLGSQLTLIQSADDFTDFARQQGLYVSWLGCQMPAKPPLAAQNQATCTANFPAGYEQKIR